MLPGMEEALQEIARLSREARQLEQQRLEAVRAARAAGATWAAIGKAAGVTREAAWQRWHTST